MITHGSRRLATTITRPSSPVPRPFLTKIICLSSPKNCNFMAAVRLISRKATRTYVRTNHSRDIDPILGILYLQATAGGDYPIGDGRSGYPGLAAYRWR